MNDERMREAGGFMAKGFGQCDPKLVEYACETFQPEDEILAFARENAERRKLPPIQVGAFDARHLEVLVRMTGARRAVEIGTLGGYSGISIARGLVPGGRLHTFELEPHNAEVARQAFARAGLSSEVITHVGPALESLPSITTEAPFDLVFIDADKVNYPKYLAWASDHLRMGGVVIADNTFAWGKIHQVDGLSAEEEKAVMALREFNHIVATSDRWRSTILPTAEGLTVAVKVKGEMT